MTIPISINIIVIYFFDHIVKKSISLCAALISCRICPCVYSTHQCRKLGWGGHVHKSLGGASSAGHIILSVLKMSRTNMHWRMPRITPPTALIYRYLPLLTTLHSFLSPQPCTNDLPSLLPLLFSLIFLPLSSPTDCLTMSSTCIS